MYRLDVINRERENVTKFQKRKKKNREEFNRDFFARRRGKRKVTRKYNEYAGREKFGLRGEKERRGKAERRSRPPPSRWIEGRLEFARNNRSEIDR